MSLWRAAGLPHPEAEYRFAPPRRWRFDYAWPEYSVALEIEGGVWTRGRHTRPNGFIRDMEKYNEAALRGWMVVRVTTDEFESGEHLEMVRRGLQFKGWKDEP